MRNIDHAPFADFSSFLQALFQKEIKAWELFYEKYGPWLLNYLLKQYIDPVYSEDLVHGAFYSLLDRINKADRLGKLNFQQDYELLSYLVGIARNIVIDDIRKNHGALNLDAVPEDAVISLNDLLAEAIDDEAVVQEYQACVLELIGQIKNVKHRRVVQLYFIDFLSPCEIVEKTGEKKDNVKKIIARIRRKLIADLRKILAENQPKQE